jgi:hypothetical protein
VDAGGGVGDEQLERALIVADLAAEPEHLRVGQGVADGEASDLRPVDRKVRLVLVGDVQLDRNRIRLKGDNAGLGTHLGELVEAHGVVNARLRGAGRDSGRWWSC